MDNPYGVSQESLKHSGSADDVGASREYSFRPASVLTPLLRIQYALLVPLLLAVGVGSVVIMDLDVQNLSETQLLLIPIAASAVVLATVGLFIATVIMHCVWTNRMNKNARALGAREMEITPGWAVGYFFIPILHLFKPFIATSEIYRASRPGRDNIGWQDEPTPVILQFWWGLWIGGNILDRVSSRMPETEPASAILGLVAACLTAGAAAAAFMWVGRLHRRQLQTYEESMRPQATPVSQAVPVTV